MNSALLGYDIGVMGGAILFIVEDFGLTEGQESIVMGSLNFMAIFGACACLCSAAAGRPPLLPALTACQLCSHARPLARARRLIPLPLAPPPARQATFAGFFSDRFGRTKTLLLASVFFLVGNLLMASSTGFAELLAGRLITGAHLCAHAPVASLPARAQHHATRATHTGRHAARPAPPAPPLSGVAVGTGLSIDPLYIAEISPPRFRGMMVTFSVRARCRVPPPPVPVPVTAPQSLRQPSISRPRPAAAPLRTPT